MLTLRGSLDVVTSSGAMGWAFSSDGRQKLTVQALLNQAIIGESVADIYRSDLATVGMGDGDCGYHIVFYQEIDPLYLPFVVVKLEGSDLDLPRATMSGFAEYFNALFKTHPLSGRQRSVFGGFWTDRIDSASLLKDRVDVGMVTTEAGAILSGFIQSGLAIVEAGASRTVAAKSPTNQKRDTASAADLTRGKVSDPVEAIATVLQSHLVLGLLHPILEGHPLALGTGIVLDSQESFRQASTMEVLPSPNECLALIVPLDDSIVELDVVRDSHVLPEFSADGQSRWVNQSSGAAIEIALRQHGMIDRYTIQPGSVAIVGPGLIHRIRAENGGSALRVHCTPSRVAPLDRMLDGSRKEIALDSGAKIWI